MISGFSLTRTINLAEGIFEWLKLFLWFVFLLVACLILARHKAGILFLTRSVILTALTLSFVGICQYFQIAFNAIPGNYAICATMANKNLFASALFLMLPFILFGVLLFSGDWFRLSTVALTGVLYAIAISETRAVWGAILISTALTVLLVFLQYKKLKLTPNEKHFYLRRTLLIAAIFVLSCSAGIWPHFTGNTSVSLAFIQPDGAELENLAFPSRPITALGSLNERMLLWRKTLRMIKDSPVLGVGLGQWRIVWPSYGMIHKLAPFGDGQREIWFQRPHNDFLWVCSETGVFGLLGYLLYWGVLICYAWRIISNSKDTPNKIFAILMLFGIIGFAIISCLAFPKERIFHGLFFVLVAGSVVSIYHAQFPIHKPMTPGKIFGLNIVLLFLLIFGLVDGHARFQAEMHTKNALAARQSKDWRQVIVEIDKADTGYYSLDPTSTPLSWYRGMARFAMGQIKEALEDFQTAYNCHPYHIHVLNNLGTCNARLKDYAKAIAHYQTALALSPDFQEAQLNLRRLYFRMAKFG
ncbi:MAG: O-antigen ligase family protein [Desulfobacterales bacterium]|nr:MAG: O-antigen ligase family protein [Desulfobacterales bacterium]